MKYRLVYKPEISMYEIQSRSTGIAPFTGEYWNTYSSHSSLPEGMQALTSLSYGSGIVVAETGSE